MSAGETVSPSRAIICPAITSSPSGRTFADGVSGLKTESISPSIDESSTMSTQSAHSGRAAPVFIHCHFPATTFAGVAADAPAVSAERSA